MVRADSQNGRVGSPVAATRGQKPQKANDGNLVRRAEMRNINTAVLFAFLVLTMKMVSAQEHVQFRSLDHNLSPSGVLLDAILFVPPGDERRPAVVFLHGCGGMFTQGNLKARERSWAQQLKALGYVVLVVDSFTPRGVKDTCSPGTFDMNVFNARPYDAYAALEWLRAQSFADAERVGVIGW
ncbi:MAG: hypothetical protein JO359_09880, partial [Candidatus Eremiobacteraeota bacterium]|nr:hypothetical protein [Candidatus Eremiobacteraeota bacterium]